MLSLRAATWRNTLTRVGLPIPFWVVHDLGILTVAEPRAAPIEERPFMGAIGLSPQARAGVAAWRATLEEIARSEVIERARQWRLGDDLIAVLLLRVLGPVVDRLLGPGRRPVLPALPLDPEVYKDLEPQLPELVARGDRSFDAAFLAHLQRESLRLVTAIEQIDLDTLRLVGMFGAEASAANAIGVVDLLAVFANAEANDIVNFSLDLLPSVLETRRSSGAQTFAVGGYAGMERRGSLDSLVLSELAFDPDIFDRRFTENEVFYYSREKQREEDRRLHYIVIDASASMRGQRAVFARGLALTLMKKLMLRGEDVYLRFFDSRLYDVSLARAMRGGKESGISVPYVLSFKGERGRNYAKVFALLADDLARLARRDKRRVVLYVLTHAECHVPIETIERLRELASLYGVFMLPSQGELDLEYLDRLHTVQVVDEAALNNREARARRALDIVEDAAGEKAAAKAKAKGEPGRGDARQA